MKRLMICFSLFATFTAIKVHAQEIEARDTSCESWASRIDNDKRNNSFTYTYDAPVISGCDVIDYEKKEIQVTANSENKTLVYSFFRPDAPELEDSITCKCKKKSQELTWHCVSYID